jgi:transcriptional regulator with XRE-family HTH domain
MSDEARRGDLDLKRNRAPDVEVTIGARIKVLRDTVGMSQATLATAIGVSFQQVQKYEKGKTRVSVSTLQSLAEALGVQSVAFFPAKSAPNDAIADTIVALEGISGFQNVTDPTVRRRFGALLRTLADKIDP